MDEFRLASMATGVVFGISLDNCILLSIARHQKCWQSRLFHRTVPLCDVDGAVGKCFARQLLQLGQKSNRILCNLQIRGATLPGADAGVQFYVQPNWSSLLDASVWGDAASQIFYSFGLASNSLVSFASYCKVCVWIHFSFAFKHHHASIINNWNGDINFTFFYRPFSLTQHSLKIIVILTLWSYR